MISTERKDAKTGRVAAILEEQEKAPKKEKKGKPVAAFTMEQNVKHNGKNYPKGTVINRKDVATDVFDILANFRI